MRPHFSLRWLLIFTALVAAACYWWIARPTIVAQQFVNSINRADYVAANAMIITPSPYGEDINPWHLLGEKLLEFSARIEPRSRDDLWRSQRRIRLSMSARPQIETQDQPTYNGRLVIPSAMNGESIALNARSTGIEISTDLRNMVSFIDTVSKRHPAD